MTTKPTMQMRLKMMVIVWLGIYPTVLGALALIRPFTGDMWLPLQVLILTVIVVPIAFLWAIPLLHRLLAEWLRPGPNA